MDFGSGKSVARSLPFHIIWGLNKPFFDHRSNSLTNTALRVQRLGSGFPWRGVLTRILHPLYHLGLPCVLRQSEVSSDNKASSLNSASCNCVTWVWDPPSQITLKCYGPYLEKWKPVDFILTINGVDKLSDNCYQWWPFWKMATITAILKIQYPDIHTFLDNRQNFSLVAPQR